MVSGDHRVKWKGYLLVLLAGSLWATLGLFFRYIDGFHISPEALALFRSGSSALFLFGFLMTQKKEFRKVARKDFGYFISFAVCIAAFFIIYIHAIKAGSIALAATLLYTCPIWVTLFARIRWGEPLYREKIIALILSIAGCSLVALASSEVQGGLGAIVLGLGSGLAYAFYSLFSNEGMKRGYAPTTMMCYGLLLASLLLLPFQAKSGWTELVGSPQVWPALMGMAVISMFAPVCYAAGQRRIGASTASILATVEPVVAASLAWLLLHETLKPIQLVGSLLVLTAVILLAKGGDHALTKKSS